jgi:hypothetical protein
VTDSSLKSVAGVTGVGMNPVVRIEPLGSLPLPRTEPGLSSPPLSLKMGCKKLRRLVLTDCHKVTEAAVWSVLMHLKNIEVNFSQEIFGFFLSGNVLLSTMRPLLWVQSALSLSGSSLSPVLLDG